MSETMQIRVDEELVREVAALARLDLTDEEKRMFVSQFRDILSYVSILDEVDTGQVLPAYLASAGQAGTRADEIEASTPTEAFLASAPEAREDYVVIPRVHLEQ